MGSSGASSASNPSSEAHLRSVPSNFCNNCLLFVKKSVSSKNPFRSFARLARMKAIARIASIMRSKRMRKHVMQTFKNLLYNKGGVDTCVACINADHEQDCFCICLQGQYLPLYFCILPHLSQSDQPSIPTLFSSNFCMNLHFACKKRPPVPRTIYSSADALPNSLVKVQ